jgi:hypothetical protein
MADTTVALVFGLKVKLTSPIVLDNAIIQKYLSFAQGLLNTALLGAVKSTLNTIPGVKVEISNVKTLLTVEEP